jgi:hypothetical protein
VRIYLAGASKELALCEGFRDRLIAAGHEITLDWMANVRKHIITQGRADRDLTSNERRKYAEADLEGVRSAELFWMLAPREPSAGCWVELGYALRVQRWVLGQIIVSGDHQKSIFCELATYVWDSHEKAFQYVKGQGS